MQETIPWTNGSGNIYLTYESGSGNDTVVVSSDVNDLDVAREQELTFTGATGLVRKVTVRQETNATEVSVTWHPTSHDDDYAYYSASVLENGFTDSNSTTYSTINLTRGSGAETYVYYGFDTSSIPDGATIESVACSVKCYISQTNSNRISTRQVQLFAGSVAKGSATTVSNNTNVQDMNVGTWTLEELRNIRLRVYAMRGSNNSTTNYYFRFYGATLSVTYKVGGKYYITSDGKAYVTSDGNYYNCK